MILVTTTKISSFGKPKNGADARIGLLLVRCLSNNLLIRYLAFSASVINIGPSAERKVMDKFK